MVLTIDITKIKVTRKKIINTPISILNRLDTLLIRNDIFFIGVTFNVLFKYLMLQKYGLRLFQYYVKSVKFFFAV